MMRTPGSHSLDSIFSGEYILDLGWDIEFANEFNQWWTDLTPDEQDAIAVGVQKLETLGLTLGYPHSSQVKGSKHGHMRELRVQIHGRPYRVFYAFNPERNAILLIGGDKGTLGDRFYEIYVPIADAIYDEHLAELEAEKKTEQKRN